MADSSPHSRVSRTRRAIALMAWGCLIGSAFLMWNARQTGVLSGGTNPVAASLLAAFGAFVGVFAWMLFNPNQRRSSDSPSLFMAAGATLFPPPMIAFCLISSDSPLRWWVALGIFLLVVIGVLSHVPDEFFGVPRGRSSYFVPLPLFDRVADGIMDPNASWFQFNDLSDIVPDQNRPSLAPKAYLNSETATRSSGNATAYSPARPSSEVDDILGTDFELGLLDDTLMDFELSEFSAPTTQRSAPQQQPATPRRATPERSRTKSSRSTSVQRRSPIRGNVYYAHNPESLRLLAASPAASGRSTQRRPQNRRTRHATSLRKETNRQPPASRNRRQETNRTSTSSPSRFKESTKNRPSRYEQQPPAPQARSTNRTQSTDAVPSRRSATPTPQRPVQPTRNTPAAPAAYLQETNQRRSDRHRESQQQLVKQTHQRSDHTDRLAAEDHVASPPEYGTSRQADQRNQERDRSRQNQRQSPRSETQRPEQTGASAAGETKSGASLFGIPMPFSSRTAEPESSTPPVVERQIDSTTTESRRRKSRYEDESSRSTGNQRTQQNLSAVAPAAPMTPPVTERRSARTESTDNQTTSRQKSREETTARRRTSESAQTESLASQTANEHEIAEEHVERTKDEHGSELVEGVMKLRFDKGQKRANLHIPFSPPLPGLPEVECECVGDVPLRLKVPVKQSYGIRIEARRTDASEDLETQIGFAAVYTPE